MHQISESQERHLAAEIGGRVRELMATLVGIVLLALAVGVWAYIWVHPLP